MQAQAPESLPALDPPGAGLLDEAGDKAEGEAADDVKMEESSLASASLPG